MVYLDYASNCPVEKEVLNLFYNISEKYYANPNSTHKLGLETKKLIDDSTKNIAKNLKVLPEEIIYTSGASESNNLVIKGICEKYKSKGKHIISTKLEHSSIIAPLNVMQENGFEVDLLDINSDGIIDINELKKLIRKDTILVSICAVDSELGIKQPIEEIGNLLKDYPNIFFHTDASQAIGKINLNLTNIDLVTIAPHKFYGLNNFGALIKKKNIILKLLINGGKSTTIFRSGTPSVANVVAMDKALEIALKNQENRMNYIKELNDIITKELKKYEKVTLNTTKNTISNIINFSLDKIDSNIFQKKLENKDIFISTKASCCINDAPSKSVYALTKDNNLAKSSLRLSLSHLTTKEEIKKFLDAFKLCYKEVYDEIL